MGGLDLVLQFHHRLDADGSFFFYWWVWLSFGRQYKAKSKSQQEAIWPENVENVQIFPAAGCFINI